MKTLMKEKRWCVRTPEKVPFIGLNSPGHQNNPAEWQTYEDMKRLADQYGNRFAGLGFFLSEREADSDLVIGTIDIDAHHTDNGEENALTKELLAFFSGTYIERSPSGNGYHVLFNMDRGRIPLDAKGSPAYKQKNAANELEIYVGTATNRYMTFTGDRVSDGDIITDQTENVLAFIARYMQRDVKTGVRSKAKERLPEVVYQEPLNAGEIDKRLAFARRQGRRGERFARLYDQGELIADDRSLTDWRLLKELVYWLGPDPAAIDYAFRRSALMRDKWDELRKGGTFGQMRIESALGAFHLYYPHEGSYGDGQCRQVFTEDGETIAELINRVAADEKHKDAVSVLPLLCGMGKSTAISQIIRQRLEAEQGLLVITDRTERLHEYMEPGRDPELRRYLKEHADDVTILDAESIPGGALLNQELHPILLMTTQRFFQLSKEEVKSFLKWIFGERTLVLIDERPEIRTNIGISSGTIGSMRAGLHGTFQGVETGTQYALESLIRDCETVIIDAQDNLTEQPVYRFLWRPDFETYRERTESTEVDVLNKVGRNRMHLEQGVNGNGIQSVFQSIHAMLDMQRDLGLVQSTRRSSGTEASRYSALIATMTNNRHCIQGIPAKVIILDGTAEISPEYLLDDYDFRTDCESKRPLNHLRIRIIKLNTTRSKLDGGARYRSMIARTVRHYVDTTGIREDPNWALFTYMDYERSLNETIKAPSTAYFGDIVGKNTFREAKHIVQVGMHRLPDWVYFRVLLDEYLGMKEDPLGLKHKNRLDELVDVNAEWLPFSYKAPFSTETPLDLMKAQSEILNTFADKHREELDDIMCSSMFADIEQMMFRGIIRNGDCAEDYTYHIFMDVEKYAGVFSQMVDRYVPLGATIEVLPEQPASILYSLMERSGLHGQETQVQRLVRWHDTELQAGMTYTDSDMKTAAGSRTDSAWRKLKSTHKAWLAPMLDTERGPESEYKKVANWYF